MRRQIFDGPVSLAFEAAARRRRNDENRPRERWHLARTPGIETWWLDDDRSSACVWGGQLTPPWRYSVHVPGVTHEAGEADSLGAAMEEAERIVQTAGSGTFRPLAADTMRQQQPGSFRPLQPWLACMAAIARSKSLMSKVTSWFLSSPVVWPMT